MRTLLSKSISLVPWRARRLIKSLPLVASLQRRLLAILLEGREFVHVVDAGPARGLSYPVTLPQDKGIWTGTYESELTQRIASTVKRGDICLDVGGWRGFIAGVMAVAGASQVFVFEPLPRNASQIRRMIELNPGLKIHLMESAIADQVGVTSFHVMPETSMAKLAASSFQPDVKGSERIEVRLETLDHLNAAGLFSRADVIKVDIEGAEVMALRGAKNLIATNRPQLFIEVHSRLLARECADFLYEYGYSIEVVETQKSPDFASEPEVCHFVAMVPV
jgi:FkbM family methyltransferase